MPVLIGNCNTIGIIHTSSYITENPVTAIDSSNSKKLLASTDSSDHLYVWNYSNKKNIFNSNNSGFYLSFSANGKYLSDGNWIYNTISWKRNQSIQSQFSSWSPDSSKFIAILDTDLYLWNVNNWTILKNYTVQIQSIAQWSPDGSRIAVLARDEIKIINSSSFNLIKKISVDFDSSSNGIVKGEWTRDSKFLVFSCGEHRLHIYNMTSYKLEKYLYGTSETITALTMDNKYVIAATEKSYLYVWNITQAGVDPIFYKKLSDTLDITKIKFIPQTNSIAVIFYQICNVWIYDFFIEPPRAIAGDDITIPVNTTVFLDGSESIGNISDNNFTWHISELNKTIIGKKVQYYFEIVGLFNISLTIKDNDGIIDVDYLNLTVYNPLDIPSLREFCPDDLNSFHLH